MSYKEKSIDENYYRKGKRAKIEFLEFRLGNGVGRDRGGHGMSVG